MKELELKIEAILFISGLPTTVKKLADLTESSEEEINTAIKELSERLSKEGALYLIETENAYQLVTKPEFAPLAQKIIKDEMTEDLSPATLETLSLIAYIGPVTKSAIEYIRGVNSTYTVRNLLVRGLVERSIHPQKSNTYLYRPSTDLIRHLGLASISELPDFDKFQELKKNLETNEI